MRAHGRALPIARIMVPKVELKHHMREYEHALCTRVAQWMPSSCHVILLADRGFATVNFFRVLDALGWDWVIRSKGNILVEIANRWLPLLLLGKTRPITLDTLMRYGKSTKGGAYAGHLVVYADSRHADPWFLLVSILPAIKTDFVTRFLRSATPRHRRKVIRVCPSHPAHPASERHTEPGVRQHVAQSGGSVQVGSHLRHSPRCGDSPRQLRERMAKNRQNDCLFSL